MFERDVALGVDASQKEITSTINNMFKEHWKRGYSYNKRKPQSMRSKHIPALMRQPQFAHYASYMQIMANSMHQYSFSRHHDDVKKELTHWDSEGGYCIYMSVLLYGLLTRDKVISTEDISFYQGYYDFPLREDMPSFFPFPKRQLGIHAWLTVAGSVVDVTANQNMQFFDFKFNKLDIILSEYPKEYKLVGFKETEETINSYLEFFSGFLGLTIEEWIEFHKRESSKFM